MDKYNNVHDSVVPTFYLLKKSETEYRSSLQKYPVEVLTVAYIFESIS